LTLAAGAAEAVARNAIDGASGDGASGDGASGDGASDCGDSDAEISEVGGRTSFSNRSIRSFSSSSCASTSSWRASISSMRLWESEIAGMNSRVRDEVLSDDKPVWLHRLFPRKGLPWAVNCGLFRLPRVYRTGGAQSHKNRGLPGNAF